MSLAGVNPPAGGFNLRGDIATGLSAFRLPLLSSSMACLCAALKEQLSAIDAIQTTHCSA